MAILIQNMSEVVNIIDTTANAGETILHALSKECKVQPIKKDLPNDIIEILSPEGLPTRRIILDGTVEYQDIAGSPIVWAGTLDDFINKLNNEYFDGGDSGTGGGDATAANQVAGNNSLASIDNNLTGVQRTPSLTRVTDATGSPIVAGAVEVSVYNAGNSNGVLLGAIIKKGETITFKVNNQKDTLGAISYDGTGTELVIQTLV